MERFEINILKLNVTETTLNIDVKVSGKYNPEVRNPIVTIIFTSGSKYRRLPVPIKTYLPETDLKSFFILAGYSYSIKDLYIDYDKPENIEVKLELTYGGDTYTDIILDKPDELKIISSRQYLVSLANDGLSIKLIRTAGDKGSANVIPVLLNGLISFAWSFILFILAVIFMPIFTIEAILEAIGLTTTASPKKYKKIMGVIEHVRWRTELIMDRTIGLSTFKNLMTKFGFYLFKPFRLKENRITFISNRRNSISGNYESIYAELIKDKNIDIKTVLDTKESFISCFKYGYYLASSKVILIDDYIRSVYEIRKRKDNYLIQVWHACGAFKAFGFSRLSKEGCWPQDSRSHRTYDYCLVSSRKVAKHYAEAFGMNVDRVIATGVPRTDIFFDEAYKRETRAKIFSAYPMLKDKKVILFAPTFRGSSKKEGNYPHYRFDYKKIFERFGDEYRIIIKHHPHVNNKPVIENEYKDRVIDLSKNEELNELLFVTDILITDYSSVIFEAALLDIPMLFYAFDLDEYISRRGFYCEYISFIPGKLVENMDEIIDALMVGEFEADKIIEFKKDFFDDLDGKSGKRASEFIKRLMKN